MIHSPALDPLGGMMLIPCRVHHGDPIVRPENITDTKVIALCGHPVWPREAITIDQYIASVVTHTLQPRNATLMRIAPRLFLKETPCVVHCTTCALGEQLTRATMCGWCRCIIFPGDSVSMVYNFSDDVVDLHDTRTRGAWNRQLVVCGRKRCANHAQEQRKNASIDLVPLGTWHACHAVLLPR